MELVELSMFELVTSLIPDAILDEQVVNGAFKQECDVDKIFAKFVQKARRALLLESI